MSSRDQYRMRSTINRVISAQEYVRIKNLRDSFGFIIRKGVGFYVKNGEQYTEEEFNKMLPLPATTLAKDNCDKTKDWLK